MVCEFCNKPDYKEEGTCCGDILIQVHKYRKKVLHSYLIEAIFDMVVSTISVILDITTLAVYANKGSWELAILTTFPIILPTTVFTNVYMTDERQDRSHLLKNKRNRFKRELQKDGSKVSFLNMIEEQSEGQRLGFLNCLACWSGTLHSLFHKDRQIRKRGAKLASKSIRRTAKYFFGTLVLRVIAWAWYLKAIVFGIKAIRQPQKFMRMEQPDKHWSRELLIRLDFLQAALENAPQCVIQLYTLLTHSDEDKTLGILTLSFSFIDFIRVTTTVFWNINKGPVVAPENSYGSFPWQILNITSWVFLYVARCSALGLIIGTAFAAAGDGSPGVIAVPILTILLHCILFAVIFSSERLGQASNKFFVTTFISIFFLPELDAKNVNVLVQFYYAMTLLENTFFITPWRGLKFSGYCFQESSKKFKDHTYEIPAISMEYLKTKPTIIEQSSEVESSCLIDPVWIVLLVPACTMAGIVMRLASMQNLARINKSRPIPAEAMTMEERVAKIYNKKWTTMTVNEMWSAFMRMLRKEVISKTDNPRTRLTDDGKNSSPFQIEVLENEQEPSFTDSTELIYKSCPIISQNRKQSSEKEKMIYESQHQASALLETNLLPFPLMMNGTNNENISYSKQMLPRKYSLPRQFFTPASYQNFNNPGNNILRNLDVRFLKVETSNGIHAFEMSHI